MTSKVFNQVMQWTTSLEKTEAPASTTVSTFYTKLGDLVLQYEPRFALLGKHIRLGYLKFKLSWTKMAIGEGPAERAFAIILGYAVASLILALYMNVLTVGNARTAGKAVRSAVRQQLLVFKVCFVSLFLW
jgi:E3 ubiquitin-protein ligase MARCH6